MATDVIRKMLVVASLLFVAACTRVSADSVRLPPRLINQTVDGIRVLQEDSEVVLTCEAEGYPEPECDWYHNHQRIETAYGMFEIIGDGDLRMRLNPLTEGQYQCLAHNPYGAVGTDPVILKRAKLYGPPPSANPANYQAAEGFSLQIPCPYTSDPKPEIVWRTVESRDDRAGVPVQLSNRVLLDEEGTLYFTEILRSDEMAGHIYQCHVHNGVIHRTLIPNAATISVTPVPSGVVPRVPVHLMYASPSAVSVTEGETLELRCIFGGAPAPDISWRRRARIRLPPQRTHISNDKTVLTIKGMRVSDQGVYVCVGYNRYEDGTGHTMEVTVDKVPTFPSDDFRPHDMNVTEGEDAVFRCNATGRPEPDVIWTVNRQPLSSFQWSAPNKARLEDNGRMLKVNIVCKDCPGGETDLAVVQCNASNIHGYALGTGYLNVLKPSVLTRTPLDTTLNYPNDVEFECAGTTDASTDGQITWYKNGALITATQNIHISSHVNTDHVTTSSLVLVIRNDADHGRSHAGGYTCENPNGYSTAHAVATLELPQETTTMSTTEGQSGCGSPTVRRRIRICSSVRRQCTVWALKSSPRSVTVCESTWWGDMNCVDRCVSDTHMECERHGTKTVYSICAGTEATPTERSTGPTPTERSTGPSPTAHSTGPTPTMRSTGPTPTMRSADI